MKNKEFLEDNIDITNDTFEITLTDKEEFTIDEDGAKFDGSSVTWFASAPIIIGKVIIVDFEGL